jgi:hypothetical protein
MEQHTIISEGSWYNIPQEQCASFRREIGDRQRGRINNIGFFVTDTNEIRLFDKFLRQNITAYFHADYNSGNAWQRISSIENLIWTLKNDVNPFPHRLPNVQRQLKEILRQDLPEILKRVRKNRLTVCVVPRSKADNRYREDQLLFRATIHDLVQQLPNFENGTKYIVRYKNTRTTHLDGNGQGGDGNLPYPGITKDTCRISHHIRNKDILLIDDLYTKSINIDEDAIQALLDNGANSVTFYSIAKTITWN